MDAVSPVPLPRSARDGGNGDNSRLFQEAEVCQYELGASPRCCMTKTFTMLPTPQDCFRANQLKVKYLDATLPGRRGLEGPAKAVHRPSERVAVHGLVLAGSGGLVSLRVMQGCSPGSATAFGETRALPSGCAGSVTPPAALSW